MKNIRDNFPERLTLDKLRENGGEQIEKTIYFSLIVEDIKYIYEPVFEDGKDENGNYKSYVLRNSIPL